MPPKPSNEVYDDDDAILQVPEVVINIVRDKFTELCQDFSQRDRLKKRIDEIDRELHDLKDERRKIARSLQAINIKRLETLRDFLAHNDTEYYYDAGFQGCSRTEDDDEWEDADEEEDTDSDAGSGEDEGGEEEEEDTDEGDDFACDEEEDTDIDDGDYTEQGSSPTDSDVQEIPTSLNVAKLQEAARAKDANIYYYLRLSFKSKKQAKAVLRVLTQRTIGPFSRPRTYEAPAYGLKIQQVSAAVLLLRPTKGTMVEKIEILPSILSGVGYQLKQVSLE